MAEELLRDCDPAKATDPAVQFVAAAHDDWALFSSRDFGYETTLVGLHGSLTPREMLIPILVA